MKNRKIVLLGSVVALGVLGGSISAMEPVRSQNYARVQSHNVGTIGVEKAAVIAYDYANYDYLDLSIASKSGNTWRIRISNPLSESLLVQYNKKMCFYGDAQNWKGLKDIEPINIGANSSVEVNISENWFATSIVASYQKGNDRVISFADNLKANERTLDQHESVVKYE